MRTRRALTVTLAALSLAAPGVASAAPGPDSTLVLRAPSGALRLVDGQSGRIVRNLPAGALSTDAKTLLTTRVHGDTTLVRRLSVSSGKVLAHRRIPGAWGIQQASADGTLVAGGERGLVVALVAAGRTHGYRGSAPVTRIAVLPPTLTGGPLHVLRLPGNFGVDALGPSGQYLYLIQHLPGERYEVRAYDLLAGRLDPHTVVDKAEPNEQMAGLPLARTENTTNTWVLTLYRRPSGVPFVHALMANSLFAFCIDLPRSARVSVSDPSTWGLALHGATLYVANAATGFVATVDMSTLAVARTITLGAQLPRVPVTHPLAASADGTRLYLARPQGLVSIDSSTLVPDASLTGRTFGSLVLGTGGTTLYAAGAGATQAFDLQTRTAVGDAWHTGRRAVVGTLSP
jgi:YVTN family beta-propeller protein